MPSHHAMTEELAGPRPHAGIAMQAMQRNLGMMLFGAAIVLLGAGLLVLRANLPRWLFGAPYNIDERWTLVTFVSYLAIGCVVLAAIAMLEILAARRGDLPLWLRLGGGTLLIAGLVGLAAHVIVPAVAKAIVGRAPSSLHGYWIMSGVLSVGAYACVVLQDAARRQRQRTLALQLESDALERDLARTELAVLEAQIEPHFLFNTLAHIKRLYRRDPQTADHALAGLIEYLQRALPALHTTDWTVGDELDLIRVYFDILALRFGPQLHFTINAAPGDRQVRIPALTVATLVENAVRHGLTPKPEGGTVRVNVERVEHGTAGRLLIEVCDDGVGLREASGTGLGLVTARARLRSHFGEQASLVVEPRPDGGVRACIRMVAK